MYNTLIRLTNDKDAAKDLLQESFITAFQKINTLGNEQAFAGWLKRIVINKGLEHLRKKTIQFEDIQETDLTTDEVEENPAIDSSTIHYAIKALPEGCRTVLCLHLLEGYKHKEIAEQLSISESTSKTQFRHAKKLLKSKLQHYYEY